MKKTTPEWMFLFGSSPPVLCICVFRKSLIGLLSLIKHPRPQIEGAATNYTPEVASDLSYDLKKMFNHAHKS
jgi:hypothetical protein